MEYLLHCDLRRLQSSDPQICKEDDAVACVTNARAAMQSAGAERAVQGYLTAITLWRPNK